MAFRVRRVIPEPYAVVTIGQDDFRVYKSGQVFAEGIFSVTELEVSDFEGTLYFDIQRAGLDSLERGKNDKLV